MYKCYECGHVFDDEDVKRWSESRGECHGFPAYEEYCGCPACNGDFDEAVPCEVCGEWCLKITSELSEDYICMDCIEKKASDFDFAYNAYSKHKESIEINGLLAGIFSECQIEEILRREYLESIKPMWAAFSHFNNHKQVAMECPEIISEAMDEELREELKKGVK